MLVLVLGLTPACGSDDGACHEPAVDLACSSVPCLPLRATAIGKCLADSRDDVGRLIAGTGGASFLLTTGGDRPELVDVLERDGRSHTERALPHNAAGLPSGTEPVVFGLLDRPPNGVASLAAARRQGDAWTTEPITFPEDSAFHWNGVSPGFDPGTVRLAAAASDGTLYALVTSTATDISTADNVGTVVTRTKADPWSVLPEPPVAPSDVGTLQAEALFVDSGGRLRLVYRRCPNLAGLPSCDIRMRVFDDPSSDRKLVTSGPGATAGVVAFLPDPDRWFSLLFLYGTQVTNPLPSSSWRAQTIDDHGTLEIPFPAQAYAGIVHRCETVTDPRFSCPGRCHSVGSRVDDAGLVVLSTGATWAYYFETVTDAVTDTGSLADNCAETIVSGGSKQTLVASRIDGGETIRGRWSLPDGAKWTSRGSANVQGAELQILLTRVSPGAVDYLRVSIDTD